MKQIIFAILFFPLFLSAQESGTISYLQTQKVNFTPRPGMPKEILDRIPKERKVNKTLVFNHSESIYKNSAIQPQENEDIDDERRQRFRRRMMGGRDNGESYKNLVSGQIIDKRDIMGKEFLVNDAIVDYQWKITGNKKQLLDYMVMEAQTVIDDTISISAWFTPQIPIQNGPSRYGGLPGLILEMDIDNGDNVIVATRVALGELDPSLTIAEPKKGKTVTREEFNTIRREKMEERREQGGGRGAGRGFRSRGN